jgi:hypothetical protein
LFAKIIFFGIIGLSGAGFIGFLVWYRFFRDPLRGNY